MSTLNQAILILFVSGYSLQMFSTDFPAANSKTLGQMTVKWKTEDPNIIIQVEKTAAGFGAIGFGSSMMSGSNALFFETTDSGSGTDGVGYRDCKLTGHSIPSSCPSNTWTVVDSTADATSFKIELSRSLTDANSDTFDFTQNTIPIIWAQGPSATTQKHSGSTNYGSDSLLVSINGNGEFSPMVASATSVLLLVFFIKY